jgi:hypothetical protein
MFKALVSFSMAGVAVVALGFAVNSALQLPDVYFSYSTDECVKVVNYKEDHNYSCELLPAKFHHVWVQ